MSSRIEIILRSGGRSCCPGQTVRTSGSSSNTLRGRSRN
jgi:hypothetical protein